MGCALALRAMADGIASAQVLFNDDDYSSVLKLSFETAYTALVRAPSPGVPVRDDATSRADSIRTVQRYEPQAIFLFATPATAASLVEEWSILGGGRAQRWYFSPTLENDSFPENTAPGAIEGMVGVAPALPADAERFAAAFRARWDGETPSGVAYRYYDALVLVALAIEAARVTNPNPTPRDIQTQMIRLSAPPGETVDWQNLAHGFDLVRSGADIDYRGASGDVDLDSQGDLTRTSAVVGFWRVDGARVVDTGDRGTCPDALFNAIME
jgi:hypothetical protein